MQSTENIENVSISIPITDLSFLRTLSKKMGWTIKRQRKSGIDRALDDIKAGRVYEARSVDDLFEQLEKWNTGSNTPAHSKSHINYVSVEAMIWRMGVSHWIRLASCLDSGKRHDDTSLPWYRNSFRHILRITWTGSSTRKSEPMYLSLWPEKRKPNLQYLSRN